MIGISYQIKKSRPHIHEDEILLPVLPLQFAGSSRNQPLQMSTNIFRYNRRSRQNLSASCACGLSVQFCHSKAIFHPHSFFPSQHPSGGKFSVKFLQTYSLFQRVIKVYSVITNYNNWLSAMTTLSLGFQKVNLFLYYSSKILRCAPHLSQYVCSFGCFAPHCGQMTAPCVTRISSFNA